MKNMKGRKSIFLVLAFCMITSFTFAAGQVEVDEPTVGATLLSLEYPFLVNLNDAMAAQASKEGIKLVPLDPRQETAKELQQIENLIIQEVDLIIMIPVDQNTSQIAAKKVNEAGIPLILVNTRFTDDFTGDYLSYIGSDDTEAGEIEGQYLVDNLPNGGNVIYLVGQYGGASTERRKTGFYNIISQYPNIEVVTELEGHGSRAEGKTIMENLLQKYPSNSIQAVVAQNDEMAIGASSAIIEAGRREEFSVIVGVDGSDAGLNAVSDGSITATIFQDAVGQGEAAIKAAKKVLNGETISKQNLIPFKLVTKENLSLFME